MSIPQGFIDEISSYGASCLDGLAEVLAAGEAETSIRINRSKGAGEPQGCKRVEWCDEGFYLDSRPAFTFDPALHQGLYYVQDASSMAISRVINHISEAEGRRRLKYLDACAAPGGKTTAAIAALPEGSLVVANEYDYRRAAVLAENIAKWGSPSVMVTRGDTARYASMTEVFDVIAADVPCSGEGMMRKEAEAVAQWSPALVADCAARQFEIVANLWPALRKGGYLIYSTCTFNRRENEEIVDRICCELGGQSVDTDLGSYDGVASGIATEHHCYRFIPGRIRGEGLFISLIRKDGDGEARPVKAAKKPLSTLSKPIAESATTKHWRKEDYALAMLGEKLIALPLAEAQWISAAATKLDVIAAGTTIATLKGRDIIPAQELALSTAFRDDAFPSVELDYQTAISFLRRENIVVDAPRGYVLVRYRQRPLGFVKNLGNRANNLYPAAWRILSQNVPAQAQEIIL